MIFEALSSVQEAVRVHWGNMILVLQAQQIRYLFIASLSVLLLAVGLRICGLRPCMEADVLSAVSLRGSRAIIGRRCTAAWLCVERLKRCVSNV